MGKEKSKKQQSDIENETENESSENEEKKSAAKVIIECMAKAKYFVDEIGEVYASIEIKNARHVLRLNSHEFKMLLIKNYYEETNKVPGADSIKQALSVLEALAYYSGANRKLSLRVAKSKSGIFIDTGSEKWDAIRIGEGDWNVVPKPPILFYRKSTTGSLPDIVEKGDINLLDKYIRFRKDLTENDLLLFKVYIMHCLVPKIPHLILVLHGEKGAAKSTTLRMTRALVDPSPIDLLSMPRSTAELALILNKNYYAAFDNLDRLSTEQSDMLCIAATGGNLEKRKLYTDDETVVMKLHRCVGLNGINVVANRPDFLDRALVLELERIPKTERKEESKIWKDFDRDKPYIFTGMLDILAKARELKPKVKLHSVDRMADALTWGYAIAEAMGAGGNAFIKAYDKNRKGANDIAISEHPVAAAIVALMKDKKKYKGTITELYRKLEAIAISERISTNSSSWPKAPSILSRRLKEVKSNLEDAGIVFDFRDGKNATLIEIAKN